MYSSSYPRATIGLETKVIRKSKGKSCGYYMRIIFFFSSLIQTLIIVSLVLFLVYGQPEKSVEEQRVEELAEGFNKLSQENVQLRKDKADLSAALKKASSEKGTLEKEVAKLKNDLNISNALALAEKQKVTQCLLDKQKVLSARSSLVPCAAAPNPGNTVEKRMFEFRLQQEMELRKIVETNFTHMVEYLQVELNKAANARDESSKEAAELKKERDTLREQQKTFVQNCKEDFAKPLEGIQTVTSAFLTRIDKLFPHAHTFHLTCAKQQEQLDKIRSSCTNLSRQVEDKFQGYLNHVSENVAQLQDVRSQLEVQNKGLMNSFQTCTNEHAALVQEKDRQMKELQESSDKRVSELIHEKKKLMLEQEKTMLQQCNPKQPTAPKPVSPFLKTHIPGMTR
ncbi:plasmalemma vesicle associated protein b isoform X2 [Denticeps clupeoides]|uniref:Uncharacterized protein n=1 Tax=Denticeps clupeoides TaxID=299321 RepID=A0AAY4DLD0_9TELE|nr:plasmalemma vesicle-associated protein-like isoform X2 [Denticeps clupeoides]